MTSSSYEEEDYPTVRVWLTPSYLHRSAASEMNLELSETPRRNRRAGLLHSWRILASNATSQAPWFAWSAEASLAKRSEHQKHGWKSDPGPHVVFHQKHRTQFSRKARCHALGTKASQKHSFATSTCSLTSSHLGTASDIWHQIPVPLLWLLFAMLLHPHKKLGPLLGASECNVPSSPPPSNNCKSLQSHFGLFQRDRLLEDLNVHLQRHQWRRTTILLFHPAVPVFGNHWLPTPPLVNQLPPALSLRLRAHRPANAQFSCWKFHLNLHFVELPTKLWMHQSCSFRLLLWTRLNSTLIFRTLRHCLGNQLFKQKKLRLVWPTARTDSRSQGGNLHQLDFHGIVGSLSIFGLHRFGVILDQRWSWHHKQISIKHGS